MLSIPGKQGRLCDSLTRRELLRIEVSGIVKDMLDRGGRPVQARLRKRLSADSLKARRMLGQCLNGLISELQTKTPARSPCPWKK